MKKHKQPAIFREFHLPEQGFRVLDLSAGLGYAAEGLKSLGASVYDNLSLWKSGNPHIDNEFVCDIDDFDFSRLPKDYKYNLIVDCCGAFYYGQRIITNVLGLLSHLENGGQLIARTNQRGSDSMDTISYYLRNKE